MIGLRTGRSFCTSAEGVLSTDCGLVGWCVLMWTMSHIECGFVNTFRNGQRMASSHSTIGRRLREIREGRGLTQAAASDAMGWARSVWNQLERETRRPSTKQLMRIRELWAVDPSWVLTGEGQNLQSGDVAPGTDDYVRLSRQVTALLEKQERMRELSEMEARLIDVWRALDPERQRALALKFGLAPLEMREAVPRLLNEPSAYSITQRVEGFIARFTALSAAEQQEFLDACEWMLAAQREREQRVPQA